VAKIGRLIDSPGSLKADNWLPVNTVKPILVGDYQNVRNFLYFLVRAVPYFRPCS